MTDQHGEGHCERHGEVQREVQSEVHGLGGLRGWCRSSGLDWRLIADAGVQVTWCQRCAGVLIRHADAPATTLRFAGMDFERFAAALIEGREGGVHPEGRYAVFVDLHEDRVTLARTGDAPGALASGEGGGPLLLELRTAAWEALRIAAKDGQLADLSAP